MTFIDVTRPGTAPKRGNLHIITKTIREIEDIFMQMGFEVAEGPEVEDEFHNFDALNIPKNHPARDMQDTFWVSGVDEMVLRTHTSGVQNRAMTDRTPPLRVIAPGRVFRNEAIDATHEAQFHQVEGLMVGKDINLAHLKGVLLQFLQTYFDNDAISLRFRPGYFPFVEPGVEVDVTCTACAGEGSDSCSVCKGSGWIEILGSGMVHPKVLESANIDSKKYQGFAFGMGIERIIMLKHGVDDIRDFYDGEIPFIKQF